MKIQAGPKEAAFKIKDWLENKGCLIRSTHVAYSPEQHAPFLINLEPLFLDPIVLQMVAGQMIAGLHIPDEPEERAVIGLGPQGAILAQNVGYHLPRWGCGAVVTSYLEEVATATITNEKEPSFVLPKTHKDTLEKRNIILVTTSIDVNLLKNIINTLKAFGKVSRILSIFTIKPTTTLKREPSLPPVKSLLCLNDFSSEIYEPTDCPLCKKEKPVDVHLYARPRQGVLSFAS